MTRTIKAYEDTVTEESLQQADSVCTDELDITVTVDELDIEDHDDSEAKAIAYAAVKAIREYGSVEPSCSDGWYCGIWYTTIDPDRNYRTGDESRYSFHFDDFTEEEQRIIHELIA